MVVQDMGDHQTAVISEGIEALVDSDGALLATVLDQSHDCIKLLNLNGIIQYVNRKGALAMELSSPSDLVGQSYLSRWPDTVQATITEALAAANRGGLGRFTADRPQSNGSPSWWDVTVSPIRSPSGTITHFVTIARDATAEVLEREHVKTISLEMRHRLKNALSVASGIVSMSARGRPEMRQFANELIDRLGQLANVQAFILDPTSDKKLTQVIPLLLEAYGDDMGLDFGNIPDVEIGDQSMQALALCYGELATNSLKYGALRNGRRVRIDGAVYNKCIELTWCENTQFGAARSGGQGLYLIERLITTAGGTFSREIGGDEMRAVMTLPIV